MVRSILGALNIVAEAPKEPPPGFLIECPDGLVVYRDEAGLPLPGVSYDIRTRQPVSGGVFVPCGRQVEVNGACPRCGNRTWVPAGPPQSSPIDLLAKAATAEEGRAAEVLHLIGRLD